MGFSLDSAHVICRADSSLILDSLDGIPEMAFPGTAAIMDWLKVNKKQTRLWKMYPLPCIAPAQTTVLPFDLWI